MRYQIQTLKKFLIVMLINMILVFECNFVFAVETVEVKPTENQFLELRAVSVTNVDGQNKQLIMELWGNDVEFKGFDVRFAYDSTKLTPSNIETNEITSNKDLYFKFEQEFSNSLNMFTIPINSGEAGIRAIVSFKPPVTESEHIIEKEDVGKVVNTNGSVLLGKMSFQMTADVFDTSFFHLIEDESSSPQTGIKINLDGANYFEEQSTFRFTDRTASKNAYLTNLILSTGEKDESSPDNSTYKKYDLDPIFDKEKLNYQLELLEYIDVINITAIKEDLKSTMKIEIPKRDENGELVYESNGTTIIYEEKEIIHEVPFELILNKLGEPDTKVKVTVTAEDGVTYNEYEILIKRPYGTIKGIIKYDEIEENENPDIKKITDLNFYKSNKINWEELKDFYCEIYDNPMTYDDLDQMEKETTAQSLEDGYFEIKLIPGTYDLQIERLGFLNNIITNIEITEGSITDLSEITIIAGDVNRDRSSWSRGYSRGSRKNGFNRRK